MILTDLYSDNSDFVSKSEEIVHFFKDRGYPDSAVNAELDRSQQISQQTALQCSSIFQFNLLLTTNI